MIRALVYGQFKENPDQKAKQQGWAVTVREQLQKVERHPGRALSHLLAAWHGQGARGSGLLLLFRSSSRLHRETEARN